MEFKYTTGANGIIFFQENTLNDEVFTLYMYQNALHLHFNNGVEDIAVISDVVLEIQKWYRVGASR